MSMASIQGRGRWPRLAVWRFSAALAVAALAALPASAQSKLELKKGDRVVIVGGAVAERMNFYGNLEARLYARFPDLDLTIRNNGWSGDEPARKMRSQDYKDHGQDLPALKPSVVLGFWGFNESFTGPKGVDAFKADLEKWVAETKALEGSPRVALISPIAHEDVRDARPHYPDPAESNANLALYTQAMKETAAKLDVPFVDLYTPTKALMTRVAEVRKANPADPAGKHLTINGVHQSAQGDELIGRMVDELLFGPAPAPKADLAKLKAAVLDKCGLHYYDYRAVNGFYIYGGRKAPFGIVNFPAEFQKLRAMITNRDGRIWAIAKGEAVPDTIDDSQTGELTKIESNVPEERRIWDAEETLASFALPEGFSATLFASERDFPDLKKPCQFAFDAKGRAWVTTMESYPMYLPGGPPPNDKVLILEDTNGDGKADKQTVFAEGLHLPTGIELGDGGAYVAQQPNLMFLKDTDGDDKADIREIVLQGFDSADSHHSISAFVWDPGGALYFQEGTFHQTSVETPYGPVREHDAAVFRYEPLSGKFESYVSYPFANPWGHCYDRWGQDFVADASGGANYFAAAFSGQTDFPDKHAGMNQFLEKQWRPTCGCVFVSSRNFPDAMQGDYLLNNCIGFQGVLQYRMREQDSGFYAVPVDPPMLKSTDPNFRPVDIRFGLDGGLFLVDWCNPLIGHMQHSVRDPKRDRTHGRIWKIKHDGKPLVDAPKIAGQPIPSVLDLLTAYEDATRMAARRELRERDHAEVLKALETWVAGLDKNGEEYWRNMLEALWLQQSLQSVKPELLKELLRCPEPKARAAATRVLCYVRDKVDEPLELLRAQVNDEHPRVRLEAVRALSFFKGADAAKAQEIATESLLHPQDYYLEYALNETNKTLDKRVKAQGQ